MPDKPDTPKEPEVPDAECPRCEDIFPEDEAGDGGICPECARIANKMDNLRKERRYPELH